MIISTWFLFVNKLMRNPILKKNSQPLMKCKVDEQTQKGVRRVKNDKRRGRNFTMEKFLKQRVNLYSWPSWNVRVALER